MSDVRLINPSALAPPIGFSHIAMSEGVIWLGGQISSDSSGKLLYPGDLVAQFGQALRNVVTALEAAGSGPEGVVKLTYFVTDIAAYRGATRTIGRAYRELMGRHYPASSLFEVKGLYEPEALIEIECVAMSSEL